MSLLLSLVPVGVLALGVSILGWGVGGALFPWGPRFFLEPPGWSFALGCALLAASVPPALAIHVTPLLVLIALAAVLIALVRQLRLPAEAASGPLPAKLPVVIFIALGLGV